MEEKTAKQRAQEWEKQYGGMAKYEYNGQIRGSISSKLGDMVKRAQEKSALEDAKYNLSFGDLARAVKATKKRISEIEGKPEELKKLRKAQLEAEYDALKNEDNLNCTTPKDLWVSERLLKYMDKPTGAYRKAKAELDAARKDLAVFTYKYKEREAELAPAIEAEKMRSMREELLSADPEVLLELGISPVKVTTTAEEAPDELPKGDYMEGTRQADYWLEEFMKSRGYGG